jgi:OmpA family
MHRSKRVAFTVIMCGSCLGLLEPKESHAQDTLPRDNGLTEYHTSPEWRESEAHPLRIAAYIVHPIGWLAREVIFRPFSYLASSTRVTRSVFGYREPYDYRESTCFSTSADIPDCRSVSPFNYDNGTGSNLDGEGNIGGPSIVFPHVNFEFDKHTLNKQGMERAAEIAKMIKDEEVESVKLIIQGHADDVGTEEYNMALGKRRAESVKEELARLGVEKERLSTVSFGESQPLIADKTDAARRSNRRVEVHVD